MLSLYFVWNVLSILGGGIFEQSSQSVTKYCMANTLCLGIRYTLMRALKLRDPGILDLLVVPLSLGISYILPASSVHHFAYLLALVGMGYKLIEGTLLLNVSFSVSRKLREEVEEGVNVQAVILIVVAAGNLLGSAYLLYRVWLVYSRTEEAHLLILMLVISIGQVLVIVYTVWLGAHDCVITNATCVGLFVSYCLYRYALRALDPECSLTQLSVAKVLGEFFSSKLMLTN